MQRIFKHLSAEEERALLEQDGEHRFVLESVIVKEGQLHTAIYVVKEGHVRVEKDSAGFGLELSRLGPGEIFGEMSFVEDLGASASVIADDPQVVLYRIDTGYIDGLETREPALFGRFYKSLSEILSHRLRETSALFATPLWEPRGLPVRSGTVDASEGEGG